MFLTLYLRIFGQCCTQIKLNCLQNPDKPLFFFTYQIRIIIICIMNNAFDIKLASVSTDIGLQLRPQVANNARKTTSAELFGGGKELVIAHANKRYVLRHTNLGKLILTK